MAVEKENVEIVRLLLTKNNLDVNMINILSAFLNKILEIRIFNYIQNYIISMMFKYSVPKKY